MSSEAALNQALKAIDTLSQTISALRERCIADGTPPPGLPRIFTHLIAHVTNVRGLVDQGQDDGEANKEAMERTIAVLEGQLRETGAFDQVERLKSSIVAKDAIIGRQKISLAEKEAELKQERKIHSKLLSDMKERHSEQLDVLWEKIHQLKMQDRVPSGKETLAEGTPGNVPMPKVGTVIASTGASTSDTIPGNDDFIYIPDSNEGVEDTVHGNGTLSVGPKRPLASDSGTQPVKKPRVLSMQVSRSGAEIGHGPTSRSSLQALQNIDVPVDASESVHRLWNLFVCAWDISEDEEQLILRQLDGVFVRGRDFESAIQRIESHVVGGFSKTPAYPRCCLLADLKNHGHGNGGLSLAKNCPYCKVDRDRICVWASYVPGVQSTYGNRLGGTISGNARQYDRVVTPWTVQLGATKARWVLHKRRTNAAESVVNPWSIGRISVTFDRDPLAG